MQWKYYFWWKYWYFLKGYIGTFYWKISGFSWGGFWENIRKKWILVVVDVECWGQLLDTMFSFEVKDFEVWLETTEDFLLLKRHKPSKFQIEEERKLLGQFNYSVWLRKKYFLLWNEVKLLQFFRCPLQTWDY